jgi:hypothetical protein
MSRKITVHSTVGNNFKEIESSARTWGDLQRDLSAYGIAYTGMKAVVGENQNSLESSQAVLPDGEMTLFLVPNKVKSGSSSLVDWQDGIDWSAEEWDNEDNAIEEYCFKTERDLAIARAKKAAYYLTELANFLIINNKAASNDPKVNNLQSMSDQIQKNLGIFD